MRPPLPADDDWALAQCLRGLSAREVSALWVCLHGAAADPSRWLASAPEGAADLRALLDLLPTATAPQRDALWAVVQRACAPIQRRAAPVHPQHALSCLYDWGCPPFDPTLRQWLCEGADPAEAPRDAASQRWLRRCVSRFPLGPTHLRALPAPSSRAVHLCDLCLWPLDALLSWLPHLGVLALVAPFRAPLLDPACAPTLARLTPALSAPLRAALQAVEVFDPRLLPTLRALGRGMILYTTAHAADINALLPRLGACLLGIACAGRFTPEGLFLAARLPPTLSPCVLDWLARAPRYPTPLSRALRRHCLSYALA